MFELLPEKPLLVVLTGAGISAESGLPTYRDTGGLWYEYNTKDVATPEAWKRKPKVVLEFYNMLRSRLPEHKPNAAHYALAALEDEFNVVIVTQNIDDLHERSGSTCVLHLHGELTKVRADVDVDAEPIDIGYESIQWGDTDENGKQLRPHIVWFGEKVTEFPWARYYAKQADVLAVIGTSLLVYPAALLAMYPARRVPRYYVNREPLPKLPFEVERLVSIIAPATVGTGVLADRLRCELARKLIA